MKPLENIRVIDLGRFVSAPFCGQLLADMGAEVIKVERPGKGEDGRVLGPFKDGESLYVPAFNRNKKGITINTRDPEGMQILKDLIKSADVVIENYRPGTIKKMGISYEELKEINPRIIVASISGYGQTGPDAFKPAFDPIAQAVGGIYAITGTADSGPLGAGTIIADLSCGLYTAYGILCAIMQREKTGVGQYIDTAMVDSMVSFMHTYVANYSANGVIPPRHGNRDLISAPADCYKCKDGYVVMHAGEDKSYEILKEIIQDPRLEDHKFDTHQDRVTYQEEMEGYIQEWFAVRTAQEAADALSNGPRGGVIAAVVNDMPRLFASEQLKARHTLVEMDTPYGNKCVFQGNPVKMSDYEVEYHRCPQIGEDNEAVLTGLLGYTADEVKAMKDKGVI